MPNEEMMMMEQMQGDTTPMPPPEMMMEQTEEVAMPEGGIASFVDAEEAPMVPEGGIASMTEMTDKLAAMGREGDIYVVHASEGDTVIPMDVLNANPQLKDMLFAQISEMGYEPERYIVGNELNSINPETGLPEFFFKKLFKSLKKIAKIALPVALAYFGPAALAASGLTAATTAAQLGPIATGLAAGAGGAAGTALTGGNLKEALTSGAISGLTAGLTATPKGATTTGSLSADRLPFQKVAPTKVAPTSFADQVRSSLNLPSQAAAEAAKATQSDFIQKSIAQAAAEGTVNPEVLTSADFLKVIPSSEVSLVDKIKAYATPFTTRGQGLRLDEFGNLIPTKMGALRAALPAAGATLGGAALMGGGGYGDNPENIYGDPTPDQIAALRVNFQDFPTTRRPYDPIVRPGRAYGRGGGLASLLPVRKMQTGGGIFDIDPTLSPSGQLDRLNELYADAYRKATTGPNPMTEAQFIASPQFQQFEDRLISTIGTLPASASGILTAPIGEGGLEDQEARAGDPTSPYSASASRIAAAMRNQLAGFGITPGQYVPPSPQTTVAPQSNMTANQAMSAQGGIGSMGNIGDIDVESLLAMGLSESDIRQIMMGQKPAPPPPPPPPPTTVGDTITAPRGVQTGGYAYYSPFYKEEPPNVSIEGLIEQGKSEEEAREAFLQDEMIRRQQAQQLASERLASARANLPRVADPVASFRQGIEEGAVRKMSIGSDEKERVYGPRRMGEVPGPLGVERDGVAADLMPGEFVFTKDAVRGAGKMAGGGYKDGIKTMYGLMKKFEGVA